MGYSIPGNREITEILTHLRSFSGNVPMYRRESKHRYSFSAYSFDTQLVIWIKFGVSTAISGQESMLFSSSNAI